MFGAVGLGQFAADASDKAEAMIAARKIQKLWNARSTISGNVHQRELFRSFLFHQRELFRSSLFVFLFQCVFIASDHFMLLILLFSTFRSE